MQVIVLSVTCFLTLTQSSWTKLHRSRKWMSGHAATALVARRIEDSSEPYSANRLGKAIPPGQGKSPFSLDGYLSWMSRISLSFNALSPLLVLIAASKRYKPTGEFLGG